jgi:hypothetical protein
MSFDFRLDRTKFAALSFEDADRQMNDYKSNTPAERLAIANNLIAIAYNFPLGTPPPIDRTFFEARNLKNGKYF